METILKWAGSKRWIARKLADIAISNLGAGRTYFEPFFGSGSVALELPAGTKMILGDLCLPLSGFWWWLRKDPKALFEAISPSWSNTEDGYYYIRHLFNSSGRFSVKTPIPSAMFLWLNKTCYNGLYRENSEGLFNVPYGKRKTVSLPTLAEIEAIAKHLASASLRIQSDYSSTLRGVSTHDVVYCFATGSMVRYDDESEQTVESVQPGDRLWNGRVVRRIFRRKVDRVYRIRVQGNPNTLVVTADHPFLAVPRKPSSSRQDTRSVEKLRAEREFVVAKNLSVGDYLFLPSTGAQQMMPPWRKIWERAEREAGGRTKRVRLKEDPIKLGRLLGWFAAEGHTDFSRGRPSSATLSLGAHEGEQIEEIKSLVRDLFGLSVKTYRPHPTAVQLRIGSSTVARFIRTLVVGQTRSTNPDKRKTKRLAPCLMTAPEEVQLALLVGWLRGDGIKENVGLTRNRARVTGTSVCEQLSRQFYRIAQRCRLRPSWIERPSGFGVQFSIREEVARLGFEVAVAKRRTCAQRRFVDGLLASRIISIEEVDYDGDVLNLEVDGDHLVCVDGVISHNCDPPYDVPEGDNDFVSYTKGGFGPVEQDQLATKLDECRRLGAYVITTNADTPRVRELYPRTVWTHEEVLEPRKIGPKVENRVAAPCLLITPRF